jgi:alkaline phosphatase
MYFPAMSCLAKKLFCTVFAAFLFFALAVSPAWAAKNVIVMVSDGAGYNSWLAASMYQGKVGKQIYDGPDWIKLSSATYPLSVSLVPTGNLEQDKKLIYDPAKVWNVERTGEKPGDFAGYSYLKSTATDSAAAATAMATGRKTYNHAENWTNDNEPMTGESISEIAKASGKSAGVITTVYWCDATPACFGGAHNVTRDNHVQIANEMLSAPWLDVIMGAGNPEFLDDGQANIQPKTADFARVGGKRTWELLKEGRHPAGWKLIQNKEDFEKLTDGCAPVPAKLLGVPPSGKTFQEKRNHGNAPLPGEIRKPLEPFEIPLDETKPSLATMSKGAIRVLSKNPRGYFLMIEGGAVDWANHDNEPERSII